MKVLFTLLPALLGCSAQRLGGLRGGNTAAVANKKDLPLPSTWLPNELRSLQQVEERELTASYSYDFDPSAPTSNPTSPPLPPPLAAGTATWQVRLVLLGSSKLPSEDPRKIAKELKKLLGGYSGSVVVKFYSRRRRLPWDTDNLNLLKTCKDSNTYLQVNIWGDSALAKDVAKGVILGDDFQKAFTSGTFCRVDKFDYRAKIEPNPPAGSLTCSPDSFELQSGDGSQIYTLTPSGAGGITVTISTCGTSGDVGVGIAIYTSDPTAGRAVTPVHPRESAACSSNPELSSVSVHVEAGTKLWIELVSTVEGAKVEVSVACLQDA